MQGLLVETQNAPRESTNFHGFEFPILKDLAEAEHLTAYYTYQVKN